MHDAMQSSRPSLALPLYYVYAPTPSEVLPTLFPLVLSFTLLFCTTVAHSCFAQAYISCSCFSLPGWVLQPQSRRFEEDFRFFPLELRGS